MVCAECTIFKKAFESFGGDYSEEETQRTPFEDLASLERSALLGCSLCQIIYQAWHYERYSEIYKEDSPIHVKGYIWDQDDSENGTEDSSESKIQGIYICYEGSNTGFTLSDFTDGRISEEAFGAYQNASRQIIDPNTPDSVGKIASLASAWIRNCRQTHQNCSYHAKRVPKVLPTRLIDVGTDVPGQPPKLFVPLRHLRSLEYIALSYAWGPQGNFIKTTSSNLEAMIQSLPWTQLPKTIQDAIAVTRRLGVRYLWVDALCILQSEGPDDMKHKEDWSYEAARFGQYYQNSLLTIAATGASSSDDGLLLPRLILRFEPKSITFRPGKAAPLRYTIRSSIPSWLSDTYFSPLSKRGWAIQERLLSRRVLHFAENMILWECHDCRATELDPQGLDPIGAEDLNLPHIEFITKCRDLYAKGLESDDFADEWYNFVTTYSAKDFTFVSDRLPALSGIAAIIQQHTQQKYIAGLWESDIPRGLAWMTHSSFRFETSHLVDPQTIGKPTKGDSRLMLPSWCWAVSGVLGSRLTRDKHFRTIAGSKAYGSRLLNDAQTS
ncbi:hypothetical protein FGADI_9031 [Fusarium gaditjirri]|uniref:Heterokaryon incompatibility domain-containing protein n=1 Tax=Fusarium gaditjirri TaxID=282569 RepID=A0A8H4T0W1_9HYPO|nr:hypothetical protein FGADI_9031 [Fusarium gaditjirri]